jgi:hypothetical protein
LISVRGCRFWSENRGGRCPLTPFQAGRWEPAKGPFSVASSTRIRFLHRCPWLLRAAVFPRLSKGDGCDACQDAGHAAGQGGPPSAAHPVGPLASAMSWRPGDGVRVILISSRPPARVSMLPSPDLPDDAQGILMSQVLQKWQRDHTDRWLNRPPSCTWKGHGRVPCMVLPAGVYPRDSREVPLHRQQPARGEYLRAAGQRLVQHRLVGVRARAGRPVEHVSVTRPRAARVQQGRLVRSRRPSRTAAMTSTTASDGYPGSSASRHGRVHPPGRYPEDRAGDRADHRGAVARDGRGDR